MTLLTVERSGRSGGRNLPVARDGLKGTVVSAEWDVESHDGLASLDEVEVLLLNAGLTSGFVVEELDLLEETGFVVLVELGAEFGTGGEGSHGDYRSEKNETRLGTGIVGGRGAVTYGCAGVRSWGGFAKVFASGSVFM